MITQLSLIKRGKKIKMSNISVVNFQVEKSLRLVSFDPKLREALDSSLAKQEAIIFMVNYQVRVDGTTELFLNELSRIKSSPKKFQVDDDEFIEPLT